MVMVDTPNIMSPIFLSTTPRLLLRWASRIGRSYANRSKNSPAMKAKNRSATAERVSMVSLKNGTDDGVGKPYRAGGQFRPGRCGHPSLVGCPMQFRHQLIARRGQQRPGKREKKAI